MLFILAGKLAWADSSFLPAIEFEYLYANKQKHEFFQNISDYGINSDDYLDFLLDDGNTLGEKVALITALASYFEWIKYDDNKYNDDEQYFEDYMLLFEDLALKAYKVTDMEDKAIPAAIRLLYTLMLDYGTFSPSIEKYNRLAEELPNSLTAQSIKVIAFGYDIIYNDKESLIKVYMRDYFEPFDRQWKNYTQDIIPEVYEYVARWNGYIDSYFSHKQRMDTNNTL